MFQAVIAIFISEDGFFWNFDEPCSAALGAMMGAVAGHPATAWLEF